MPVITWILLFLISFSITSPALSAPDITAVNTYEKKLSLTQDDMRQMISAFQVENEALQAMIHSIEGAMGQMKLWSGKGKEVVQMNCPNSLELLAKIGADQIDPVDLKNEILAALAQDLGQEVSFALSQTKTNVQISRKNILQQITLADGVNWSDLIEIMQFEIKYMRERIRLNNQAFLP